jgi:hypothetical protein
MVSHADLTMYLVGIKSLCRQLGEGSVVVMNDGTLTGKDIDTLRHHLEPIEFLNIADVPTGVCPVGGTWERLLKIIDLTTDFYVIQMDSDTLTQKAILEVVDCYRSNRSFILGSYTGPTLSPLAEAPEKVRDFKSDHVQIVCERKFGQLENAESLFYVRGSSGFAGFSRGAFSRRPIEEFSSAMTELVGRETWAKWGTEQITSNYALANSPDVIVLPHPKYSCYLRGHDPAKSVFLHFIGAYRFHRGVYARESAKVIKGLFEESL